MAVSEAQKRATAKWNKEHLTTLGCTIDRNKAQAFKDKCKANGLTANAVLIQFVESYIEEENPV